jgi:hypothetical protein
VVIRYLYNSTLKERRTRRTKALKRKRSIGERLRKKRSE